MISAFDVYLVMQLDSIRSLLEFVSIIGTVVAIAMCLFGVVENEPEVLSSGKKFACAVLFVTLAGTLLPSSKTAAAMILIPALTSKEVVEPVAAEAKELYVLAKKALRELGEDEKKSDE